MKLTLFTFPVEYNSHVCANCNVWQSLLPIIYCVLLLHLVRMQLPAEDSYTPITLASLSPPC